MKDICNVTLSPQALKDLKKVPLHIAIKLQAWIDDVGHRGLMAARKIPGYHDEPLKGKRQSQRSIRLSCAYRSIYTIDEHQNIQCVTIVEVNKHDYYKHNDAALAQSAGKNHGRATQAWSSACGNPSSGRDDRDGIRAKAQHQQTVSV